MGDFEKYAAEALGTDDPAKLSALKEAIMACMETDYESDDAEDGPKSKPGKSADMALIFGDGKK